MINYFHALSLLFNNIDKSSFLKKSFICSLDYCVGEICNFDFISFKNVPNFDSSAMDGYAVKFNTVKYNFDSNKNRFFIIDLIKAGDLNVSLFFDGNYVIEIMTGARIPVFFDTVVKIEDVIPDICNPFEVVFRKVLSFKENVRVLGDDFKIGNFILKKGNVFFLKDYVSTSTFGLKNLFFLDKFKVSLICTGNEVVDTFIFDQNKNVINNSLNKFFLFFFKNMALDVSYYGVSLDLKTELKEKIINLINSNSSNLIITTGAVSKGKADIIPSILAELNVNIIFHGVSIKPGKPILFANYLNKHYFFCLPGNPISSIIGLRFFVYPFIRYIIGSGFESPIKAFLENDYTVNRNVDLFLKSFVYFSKSNFYVRIMDDQQSFKVKSFVEANSFIFLRTYESSKRGDILNIYFYEAF